MVRTRFAPSPTGDLHLGGVRTALFNWAFARHCGGQFILRIEDTDQKRSAQNCVQGILDGLSWLNIDYDEGPYFQSARYDRYRKVVQQLLDDGHAYYCYCSIEELDTMREEQRQRNEKPRYDGRCHHHPPSLSQAAERMPVIRFHQPKEGRVSWNDCVKGLITIENSELDDFIIVRADGSPTYNFCVVVDDYDMQITHVIRGDDHVNNTPRQINILKALNAPLPEYGHLSMILGGDGQKLSKRHGAASVLAQADEGILSDALINYLSRLGWSYNNEEVYSVQQWVEWFDMTRLHSVAARFDQKKLLWVNSQHLQKLDPKLLLQKHFNISEHQQASYIAMIALYQQRSSTLLELKASVERAFQDTVVSPDIWGAEITTHNQKALLSFIEALKDTQWYSLDDCSHFVKEMCTRYQLKLPHLAIPLKLMLFAVKDTPPVTALFFTLGAPSLYHRLKQYIPILLQKECK